MGGSNDKTNMVRLTAREHFVAHQLLVKIYQKEYGLIIAVNMMCIGQEERKRANNRMYSWLRERFVSEQSRNQTGEGNSQFGTMWIHNLEEQVSKKIPKDDLLFWEQQGWERGRVVNFTNKLLSIRVKAEKEARVIEEKALKVKEKLRLNKANIVKKQKLSSDRKILAEEYYCIYRAVGFVEFTKLTGYSKSLECLIMFFKRNVEHYVSFDHKEVKKKRKVNQSGD
jgi:hypothetical protein